jgi:hypothetical protein
MKEGERLGRWEGKIKPGLRTEVGGRRADDRDQITEVGGQRSEVRLQDNSDKQF